MKFLFILLLVISPLITNAQIFKCKTSTGKITYSESACPKNMSGGEIILEDNAIDSSYLRNKVESQKMQKLNSSSSQTTVTTMISNNSNKYMTSYDKEIRLKQLKVQMSDMTYFEKKADAENEYSKLSSREPRSLTYELEKRRNNLKVDLTHRDPLKRQNALRDLSDVYANY